MSSVIADKFYTVAEACKMLNLTRQRVCALIKSGQLEADKAHRMLWLIPAKSLENFQKLDRPSGQHISARELPSRRKRR